MKKLKYYILLFCIAVSIPLFYVVWWTYDTLAAEERSKLRFFTESLFGEMENEMAALLEREENRTVDAYSFKLSENNTAVKDAMAFSLEPFILGYLQNNPDGSFQTPVVKDLNTIPSEYRNRVKKLEEINRIFNQRKWIIAGKASLPAPVKKVSEEKKEKQTTKPDFAGQYLSSEKQASKRLYLGKKKARVEIITQWQAANLAQKEDKEIRALSGTDTVFKTMKPEAKKGVDLLRDSVTSQMEQVKRQSTQPLETIDVAPYGFQVEVAPFQAMFIDKTHVFIFRRVEIRNRIYRQGFVLMVKPFLHHLVSVHYDSQPIAGFTRLSFMVQNRGDRMDLFAAGAASEHGDLISDRTFPAPFDFLYVAIRADQFPISPARRSLNIALGIFGAFMLLGLFAIYHSTRKVLDLSERRAGFVSSVTHELKTPLTNIRMYIEMLEQGMASDVDQEQAYFKVLGSESARLSRLINNVLELSRLEKKQRHFKVSEGVFDDVPAKAAKIMEGTLLKEGFALDIRQNSSAVFLYDREVMIQVLINLMDNCVKFGRHAREKKITIRVDLQGDRVYIGISDTGPGIPKRALKKVFDDFYRVDNDLTRTTGGTGIGLALVKKIVRGLGGTVKASNNKDVGCTITLIFPVKK